MSIYDNVVEIDELKVGKIFYIVDVESRKVIKVVYTGKVKDGWGIVLRDASIMGDSKEYVMSRGYIHRSEKDAEERLAKTVSDLVEFEKAGLINTRELADYAKTHLDNNDEIVNRAIVERALELNLDLKRVISEM